jgi:hypothetical protein
MAQPTNTFSSYDAKGNREDLVNAIYSVDQTKTPFTSAIGKISATATLHEWQTDALAAAGANAVIEGDEASTDASIATVRLGNYTQISDKVALVAGTQQAVDSAGRSSDMAYQMAKRMQELKRDIELAACANNAKAVGNDTTARESAGIESWIASNTSAGTGGSDPAGTGADARTDGTQRAYLEADLKAVLASAADEGGDPNMLLLGSFNKQAMSAFSGNGTRTYEGSTNTLDTAIDIYKSDFGILEVVFSPQSRSRSAIAIDTSMWKLAMLPGRSYMQRDLAISGDYMRKQVLCEWTLQCDNEKANGIVADLTTS